jgi:hypothetical protein
LRSLAIFWRFSGRAFTDFRFQSAFAAEPVTRGDDALAAGAGPLQFYPADVAKLMRFLNWTLAFGAVQAVPDPSMDFIRLDRGRLSIIFLPMESAPKTGTDLR